jgi:CheY-like chemotaxis protein
MEAIGRLAGGIAHDFNNLLTVIQGYSEMLLATLPGGDPRRDDALEIERAADRAATLTRQLLAFGRRAVLRPRPTDLNTTIGGVSRMLERVIGEDVDLQLVLAPELWLVYVDSGQVEQVIVNLAVNARDAMTGGGRFTIETGNAVIDEAAAAKHVGMAPGEYVRLVASDTGQGIAAEHLPHLFEPFFTTKDPGKGTGLGLATVFGIVSMSGGFITVSGAPGRGATFTIHLPRIADPAAAGPIEAGRTIQAGVSAPVGTERVLVAEDDTAVRTMIGSTLTGAGYDVTLTEDGTTALEAARESRFDLLVTDIVMPDITGAELARRLTDVHPPIPVLYSSGYDVGALTDRGMLAEGVELIEKPYGPRELLERVRAILDASRQAGA